MVADGSELVTIKDDLQSYIGTAGPLLICVTRRPPTLLSIDVFRDALRQHHARFQKEMRLLVVLRAHRPKLTQGVRSRVLDLWNEFGGKSTVAVVVGRDSLAGALQRRFIEAVALIKVRNTPFKVARDVEEAVEWLVAREEQGEEFREDWLLAARMALSGDTTRAAVGEAL